MRDLDSSPLPAGRKVDFLDASEEEAVDLVRSLLGQLAIMASCLSMSAERRETLKANIAHFEAYLNRRNPKS